MCVVVCRVHVTCVVDSPVAVVLCVCNPVVVLVQILYVLCSLSGGLLCGSHTFGVVLVDSGCLQHGQSAFTGYA